MRRISADLARLIAVAIATGLVVLSVPVLAHGVEHAVFAHNSDKVDGMHVKKFRQTGGPTETPKTILSIGSLRLHYSCYTSGSFGSNPEVTASTTVDNASIDVGFITGSDGYGSAFHAVDDSFNRGETFSLTNNRIFGHGSLTYTTSRGKAVSVDYGFNGGSAGCLIHGTAIGS